MEVGVGPNPDPKLDVEISDRLRLRSIQPFATSEEACVEALEERCGTVIVKPTTAGGSAALFEFNGEFCIAAGQDDHQALYAAVWHVSQQ